MPTLLSHAPPVALLLLRTWSDALVAHQIPSGDEQGGLMCPACGMVHGRCGDAVYPLLALFARTGNDTYRQAALDVYGWAERHVSQPDGSWRNETYPGAWQGTTCFSLLAVGEALRHYSPCLPPETAQLWRERVRRGADFLMDFMTPDVGDINYPISTAAALALAHTLLGDEQYKHRARELAYFGLEHLTQNGLLWGEGPRGPDDVSPRGLRPIDVGYNVEESLPNLALYGKLTGDDTVLEAAAASLRAHLPFLLPDGGWDAGWCSRQYKWTYWGSRTTDGGAFGFAALQGRDPRFAPAAAVNLRLLAACTHGGLLYGGPHLHGRGIAFCIHHTFCHAKGLAAALDAVLTEDAAAILPPPPDGVREWPEATVCQVTCGGWRASVTANDLPHTEKRGGYPSGGSLSLLWHEQTGPLCVASMNDYVRYEGTNMQEATCDADRFVLTPRLEWDAGGERFSSLHDGAAHMEWHVGAEEINVTARGVLQTRQGAAAAGGEYRLAYRFTHTQFECIVSCGLPGVRFVFPLVSPGNEAAVVQQDVVEVHKPGTTVTVQIAGARWENTEVARIFNFVPGMECLPLIAPLKGEARLTLRIL